MTDLVRDALVFVALPFGAGLVLAAWIPHGPSAPMTEPPAGQGPVPAPAPTPPDSGPSEALLACTEALARHHCPIDEATAWETDPDGAERTRSVLDGCLVDAHVWTDCTEAPCLITVCTLDSLAELQRCADLAALAIPRRWTAHTDEVGATWKLLTLQAQDPPPDVDPDALDSSVRVRRLLLERNLAEHL